MSGELVTEIIRKCLTPCPECPRRYISEVLEKRLICYCSCHSEASTGKKVGSEKI